MGFNAIKYFFKLLVQVKITPNIKKLKFKKISHDHLIFPILKFTIS